MLQWKDNILNSRAVPLQISRYKSTSNSLLNHLLSIQAYSYPIKDHIIGWLKYRTDINSAATIKIDRYDFPIILTVTSAISLNLKFSPSIQKTLKSKERVVKEARSSFNKYAKEVALGNRYYNNYTILFGLASVAPGLSVNRIVTTADKLQRPSQRKGKAVEDLRQNIKGGKISSAHITNFINDAQRAFWDTVLTSRVEKQAIEDLDAYLIGDKTIRQPKKFRFWTGHLKRDTVIRFKRYARFNTLQIKVPGYPDSRVHLEKKDRLFVDIDVPLEKMAMQGLQAWMERNVNLSYLENDTIWELLNFSSQTKKAKYGNTN